MNSDESESEENTGTGSENEETIEEKTEDTGTKSEKLNQNLGDRDQKQSTLERCLPRINCEEHIVFVLDLSKEVDSTLFQLSDGSSYSSLHLMKKALSLFIHNKKAIDPRHKFALMVLEESPIWVVDLTSNPRDIINQMETLEEGSLPTRCDLSQVFDLIKSEVTLPSTDPNTYSVAPPPYIVRTVLLYRRSLCLPQFLNGKESYDALINNPHYFLDVLYVHEPPKDENKCEGIFDLLCDLDQTGWSYIFETGRNAAKLHSQCSKLLAHPLQRPPQKDAQYTLPIKE